MSTPFPLSSTSELFCIADEGSVSVLSSSFLRQANSIPLASAAVALHIEPYSTNSSASNQQQNKKQNAQQQRLSTIDVDGTVSFTPLLNSGKSSSALSANRVETFPISLTSAAARRNASTTVLAATLQKNSGFSFFGNNNNGGKNPLIASALLSDGTVVRCDVSDVDTTNHKPIKVLGRHARVAQMSNVLFTASPTLPLVVISQVGSKSLFILFNDEEEHVVEQQQSQEDAATTGTKKKTSASAAAANKKKAQKQEEKKSDNDDDSDVDEDDAQPQKSSSSSTVRTAIEIKSPIVVSSICLHPTRATLAIGGVRGEVAVIQDLFSASSRNANKNFQQQNQNQHQHSTSSSSRNIFIDHWHHTPVSALSFGGGQEGTLLLSGGSEGVLCLWNIGSNYARTNIGLGSGISEVSKITAINVANDEPSRCFVCIGEGEIQIASVDLTNRRLVARRDGMTIASSLTTGEANALTSSLKNYVDIVTSTTNSSEENTVVLSANLVTSPVSWLAGSAVTAIFLYKRTSGRIRLYDPFERRSLRSSVLTASVETIPNPPTVGLQLLSSTSDGKRLICFESSKEKIMPPLMRWLVYDETGKRFKQVQQAADPHPGDDELVAAFWLSSTSLVTVSKQRLKVWKMLHEQNQNETTSNQFQSLLTVAKSQRKKFHKNTEQEESELHLLMTCAHDVVFKYHPTLSLLGTGRVSAAAISPDASVLYLASDVLAVVDLRSLLSVSAAPIATPTVNALIASGSGASASGASAASIISTSNNTAVVAYSDSVSIFGICKNSGTFAKRATLFQKTDDASTSHKIISISAPFTSSTSDSSSSSDINNANNANLFVALVAAQEGAGQPNNKNKIIPKLCLIDSVSCQIVSSIVWDEKYLPMSRQSLTLLSPISPTSASSWKCTIGVATTQRGFRTLNVVLKQRGEEDENENKKKPTSNAANNNNDDDASTIKNAPAKINNQEDEQTFARRNQDKISNFFRRVDQHTFGVSTGATFTLETEKSLLMKTGEQVEIAKKCARYGKEVLNATTFFASAPMSSVTSSVFERLERE